MIYKKEVKVNSKTLGCFHVSDCVFRPGDVIRHAGWPTIIDDPHSPDLAARDPPTLPTVLHAFLYRPDCRQTPSLQGCWPAFLQHALSNVFFQLSPLSGYWVCRRVGRACGSSFVATPKTPNDCRSSLSIVHVSFVHVTFSDRKFLWSPY